MRCAIILTVAALFLVAEAKPVSETPSENKVIEVDQVKEKKALDESIVVPIAAAIVDATKEEKTPEESVVVPIAAAVVEATKEEKIVPIVAVEKPKSTEHVIKLDTTASEKKVRNPKKISDISSTKRETPNEKEVTVVASSSDNEPGSYSYSYELSDGTSRKESGVITNYGEENESLAIVGSYSFVDSEGVLRTVNYIADENGFQPVFT